MTVEPLPGSVVLHGAEMLEYPWVFPGQQIALRLRDDTIVCGTVIGTPEFDPEKYIVVRTAVARADVLTASVSPGEWPPPREQEQRS